MSETYIHPEPERLEAYAAGEHAASDAAIVESHLLACARCRAEVEEWRTLFSALADLPELEPAAGFADRVMASVRIQQPLGARALALADRVVPKTRRAWTLVAAMLGLPTLGLSAILAWVLTRPWITVQGLFSFGTRQVMAAFAVLPARAFDLVSHSAAGVWIADALNALSVRGAGPIGAAAALFATLTIASAWVLYRNLFRTPRRDEHYATFSF